MNQLQVEIIRRIFHDFGVSIAESRLANDLVANDETICDFTLPVVVGEVTTQKPIWSAQLEVATAVVRVILTDLSDEDFGEFALAFVGTDLPLYGIRLSSDPEDAGVFSVRAGNEWVPLTIGLQASVLSGVEQLQSFALNWRKCENTDDLHDALITLLNTGDDE